MSPTNSGGKELSKLSEEKDMEKSFRHGEIVIKPATTKGEGETTEATSYIVGHSETGHHHVLESTNPFRVTKDKIGKLWLELETEAKLIHQKQTDVHETLTIPAGLWEVGQKTEYDPFNKVIARVRD